jgi:uncharacterized protein (TIGR02594 family)
MDLKATLTLGCHYEIHKYLRVENGKGVESTIVNQVNDNSGAVVGTFDAVPQGFNVYALFQPMNSGKAKVASNDLPDYVNVAITEINTLENLDDDLDNPRISCDYFGSVGKTRFSTHDKTPWCAAFMNWVFEMCGREGTNSATALDWRSWKGGEKVDEPYLGTLVTIKHKDGTGHVGIVTGKRVNSKGDVEIAILGGNQSVPGGDKELGLIVNVNWVKVADNMVFIHPIGVAKKALTEKSVAPTSTDSVTQITGPNSR